MSEWASFDNPSEGTCCKCLRHTPMYWVPNNFWERYVPEPIRHLHVCFGCFLALVHGGGVWLALDVAVARLIRSDLASIVRTCRIGERCEECTARERVRKELLEAMPS